MLAFSMQNKKQQQTGGEHRQAGADEQGAFTIERSASRLRTVWSSRVPSGQPAAWCSAQDYFVAATPALAASWSSAPPGEEGSTSVSSTPEQVGSRQRLQQPACALEVDDS